MSQTIDQRTEWIEADGLGGFASGTTSGIRTRRYHALLLASSAPPTRRSVLVSGVEAWLDREGESIGLSSHLYDPGTTFPHGTLLLQSFINDPWPTWTYRLPTGEELVHELFVPRGMPVAVLSWKLAGPRRGGHACLRVRPLLACRDYHALHHENPEFRFDAACTDEATSWRPYEGVPGVLVLSNGRYRHSPDWYRHFLYRAERERGFDATEDLGAPGEFVFDLALGDAALIFGAQTPGLPGTFAGRNAGSWLSELRSTERARRRSFAGPLVRAATSYIVARGEGRSIIAGYPWFADWGRDTFIALRGICLATGRLADARSILLQWAEQLSEGMLPNRFADDGERVEFNAVDASLWFAVCVFEFPEAADAAPDAVDGLRNDDRMRLIDAVHRILEAYSRGTRHGIRADTDGLLAAGEPGVQLTWMDARVGDRVITPRIGKPVEVQALWVNALWIGSTFRDTWRGPFENALASFRARFWSEEAQCLYDVVDADHVPGRLDDSIRPNQILAVGGLPLCLLKPQQARALVDRVERELLTPKGLRSLAPSDPDYCPRYDGGPAERDGAYHQGTVWPWLMGPFVEAWVRVRNGGPEVIGEARERFLAPLTEHLAEAGLGHVSEIADAQAPHEPRGCPFQAWSLGELLRLDRQVLAVPAPNDKGPARPAAVRVPRQEPAPPSRSG